MPLKIRILSFIILITWNLQYIVGQNAVSDNLEQILSQKNDFDTASINNLIKLSQIKPDNALEYLLKAKNISDSLNLNDKKAECRYLLGTYFFKKTEHSQSIKYFQEALENKSSNQSQVAETYLYLGKIYHKLGDYPKAYEYIQNALKLFENQNNSYGIAKCYQNLGNFHIKQSNPKEAVILYDKALSIYRKINNKRGIADIYNNFGVIHLSEKKFDKALSDLQESSRQHSILKDGEGLATSYINIGTVFGYKHQYDSAFIYYTKALDINDSIRNQLIYCNIYINFGHINLLQKKYAKTSAFLKKALTYAEELELLDKQALIYSLLTQIYVETNDYKKAYDSQISYQNLIDSIYNSEKLKKITGLEYKYRYEKKIAIDSIAYNKELKIKELEISGKTKQRNSFLLIALVMLILIIILYINSKQKRKAHELLKKQKLEIEDKNKTLNEQTEKIQNQLKSLEIANKTKDKFFSIIAHDLKSPFNVILGFSELLHENFDSYDKSNLKKFVRNIYLSSNQVYRLLSNLLEWARTQNQAINIKPEYIRLSELIEENIKLIKKQAEIKNITINYVPDTEIIIFADKHSINTVIRNLLSNAVKYTEKGEIKILTERFDKHCKVTISDSGIGIQPDKLNILFSFDKIISTKGTAGEVGTGLGLELCRTFTEKNGGKISVESTVGKGSKFSFTVPIKSE